MQKQWLVNQYFDGFGILLPHYIGLILLLLFPNIFAAFSENIPTIAWVILVLCIDVAHVYSTLFRTYFDKIAWQNNKSTLIIIPIICFVISVLAYSVDAIFFWRLLAYTAVYHFIRQQYGILKLYLRKTNAPEWSNNLDIYAIYLFTFLPILIWHFSGLKNFNWFVDNDFIYLPNQILKNIVTFIFYLIFLSYILKEIYIYLKYGIFALPKALLLIGTALSWFVGIVILNGDLAFTLLNVVSHGIPYMALVWMYGAKNYRNNSNYSFLKNIFSHIGLPIFVACVLLFAFLEEGIWDGLVWREHSQVFAFFQMLPDLSESEYLKILVPLLSLPQATHYVLDGFIWKIKEDTFYWKKLTD
jgi:hypothetical protein